jgi:DNA-binding NarL/FixJ family response regulator
VKGRVKVAERDAQLEQLVQIRKLLILLLLKSGATSPEIARALKIDSSTLRKQMPTKVGQFAVSDRDQMELLKKIEKNTRSR